MRIAQFSVATFCLALSSAAVLYACGGNSSSPNAPVDSGPTQTSGGQDGSTTDLMDASITKDAAPSDAGAPDVTTNACATPSAQGYQVASHPPLPDMVYGGGGILTAPKLITFTFSDTYEPQKLAAFGQTITQTPWFAQVTKDYCVDDGGTCIQPGTAGDWVAVDAGSAGVWVDNSFNNPGTGLSDAGTDFVGFLLSQVAQVTDGGIEASDPNNVYMFYFSPKATFYMGDPNQGGSAGCGFGGYHNAVASLEDGGGVPITYAIIVDCAAGQGSYELEGLTVAASHELIEATTDPYPAGGWYLDQDMTGNAPTDANLKNQAWADTDQFGEIGDNCESLINSTWELDGGDVVQRIWSTSAAAAGQNPCIPVPAGETYFNATPDKAIYVADVGASFTVDITGFAPTPRPGWAIQGVDQTPSFLPDGGTNAPLLSMELVGGVDAGLVAPGSPEIPCINNGTTAQLKVTLLSDPSSDDALNNPYVQPIWQQAEGVIVSLDTSAQPLSAGGSAIYYPYQLWPFAVVTPSTAAAIGLTSSGLNSQSHPRKPNSKAKPRRAHPRTWEKAHFRNASPSKK
jgi:hypothetical protein